MKPRSQKKQLELGLGAKKKKRGRPRKPGAVSHRTRPSFESKFPQLVTIRVEPRTCNLRSRRAFKVIERAFWGAMKLTEARVCEFSVQGNHVHILVETDDAKTLTRTMQSLDIRLGKNLNRLMETSGRIVAHRYHSRSLRTPTEVRNARNYVRGNYLKHAAEWGETIDPSYLDPYSSQIYRGLPSPETWLLRVGWQRAPGETTRPPAS